MNASEVKEFLSTMAEELTPAAQYLFDLTVRQVLIEGALYGIAGLVLVTLFTFLLFKALSYVRSDRNTSWERHKQRPDYHDRPDDVVYGLVNGAIIVVYITALSLFAGMMISAVIKLLNPEFAAIQRIVSMATGV